ncbi:cell envelope integrity protein TolA [Mesorhizobium sp. B2-4-6]|uniref:cell envelope integrity protein TolA n=1 Tax=Mesorhizobium sp. B2-4-6 TaxID=2589943 RepID=UPI001126FABD|nr:cell envelope integrity protein TolA [Mesorhizobium sp. B2-4-6]TPL51758.1 cell envelope integrity protein TolA [Mesorhizobium sp. B2-4-6]
MRASVFALSFAILLALSGGVSRADVALQRDIGAYLMRAIQVCWIPPAGTHGVARVKISLNKDGSLAGPPRILSPVTPSPDEVAEAAVRAIRRCAPFPGLTSYADHYDLWRDVVLTFNPAEDTSQKPLGIDAKDLEKLLEKYSKKPD